MKYCVYVCDSTKRPPLFYLRRIARETKRRTDLDIVPTWSHFGTSAFKTYVSQYTSRSYYSFGFVLIRLVLERD